ncbi:MAG TPA: MmgE/PrpD family protein, partial [Bradyrhizobium sp.]
RELESPAEIEAVSILVPEAAARYPGCDSKGPYRNALQAKMSIPFSVAAVLARGTIEEDNYAEIEDPRILRLVERTDLQRDTGFTAAFPAQQGAEVSVRLRGGKTIRRRLDNVIAATPEEIRTRFRQAASDAIGCSRARGLEELVDGCERLPDSGDIAKQCRLEPPERLLRPAS